MAWNGQLSSTPFIIIIIVVVVDCSWDSSLGIAPGYVLDDQSSISGMGKRFFSSPQRSDGL
jgi:hypothetical protein